MRLAARHGYEGTKISMIRQVTSVSASSIYWHFSGKDELIAAALEHAFRAHSQTVPSWLDPVNVESRSTDLYGKLRRFPPIEPDMDYWRFGLQLAVVRPPVAYPARARFLQIRRVSIERMARWWERSLPERMVQRTTAALMLARFTLGIRESLFIQRHGDRRLDERRVTWMLSACLDAVAQRSVELAPHQRLDATREPAPYPQPAQTEGVRAVFLRAAEEAIAELGYDGVTVAGVCEKAELPASSLYWAFTDKDDLLATVIADACHSWEATPQTWGPRPADGNWSATLHEQLLRLLEGLGAGTKALRLGLLLLLPRANVADDGRHDLELVLQDMQNVTAEWFRSVLSPVMADEPRAELAEYLSECLFRLLEGMLLSKQIDGRPWDPELLADLMSTALYRVATLAQDGTTIPAPG